MLIVISRHDFNGPPLFLNGTPLAIVTGVPIEVSQDYLDIIDRARIPYMLVPTGALTGQYVIPADFGPRLQVTINGTQRYLRTGVATTFTAGEIEVLGSAGIPLIAQYDGSSAPVPMFQRPEFFITPFFGS